MNSKARKTPYASIYHDGLYMRDDLNEILSRLLGNRKFILIFGITLHVIEANNANEARALLCQELERRHGEDSPAIQNIQNYLLSAMLSALNWSNPIQVFDREKIARSGVTPVTIIVARNRDEATDVLASQPFLDRVGLEVP